ncbi:protease modulator HflC [Taklimakanibacter lacteus]|uniref:protease modulator HflC n=1 Tax=Taklimakanibacter lacteus TaxID=2268456 RepID=UPI000E667DD4
MSLFRSTGIIVLAVLGLIVWSSTFIVDEREKALVLRFGEINRIVEKPGLYFKIPVADDVVPIEDRMIVWTSDNMSVQVVDGRRYLVDAVTMARIVNAQRFRETVSADISRAWDRIRTRLDAALRQTYGKRTFDAALSKDRAVMMREIRDQVRSEALNNGIEIVDVRIVRTDLMDEVLKNTYERMSSERIAEAKDLRGRGEARKIEIMAQADRAYTEKLADARRQSEVIRGEGEGERNKVFADAFQQDPEFFAFYRSMQAYAKSLSSSGTTLVLKPDSDFFKYLGMDKAKPPVP